MSLHLQEKKLKENPDEFDICDMIKRNESDVGDILVLRYWQKQCSNVLYIVFTIDKFFITLQPDIQL